MACRPPCSSLLCIIIRDDIIRASHDRVPLPHQLLDEGARRLTIAGGARLAMVIVVWHVLQRAGAAAARADPRRSRQPAHRALCGSDGGRPVRAASLRRRHIAHAARPRHGVRGRRRLLDCHGRDVAAVRCADRRAGTFGHRSLDRRCRRTDSQPAQRPTRRWRWRRRRPGPWRTGSTRRASISSPSRGGRRRSGRR